ncbi:MAG: phage terminase large subunit [Chloroherpetonaceae bacterium]
MIDAQVIRAIAAKHKVNPNRVFVDVALKMPNVRLILLEGGTRSGKTYSVLEELIELARHYSLGIVSIVRETRASMQGSVEREFFKILASKKIYDESKHNKSLHYYRLNDTLFEFFGADNPQKLRGSERNILFANEVNGFKYYSFNELAIRTTHKIICDYNPTILSNHFIYKSIIPRADAVLFKSNYFDNLANLTESQIREIESFKQTNYEWYRTMGLGERASLQGAIYPHWQIGEYKRSDNEIVVMDLGYNDPTTITLMNRQYSDAHGREVFYVKNIYYERFKSVGELIRDMHSLGLRDKMIVSDISPQVVHTLRANWFRVLDAVKGNAKFSKVDAVKLFQSEMVIMDKQSIHLHSEQASYAWWFDEKAGVFYDKLKDGNDHILDAILYGFMTVYQQRYSLNSRIGLQIEGFHHSLFK